MNGKLMGYDEGETLSGIGGSVRYLLTAAETAGSLGALVQTVGPGSGPPLHRHEGYDEALFILTGAVEATLESETRRLAPGGFLYVPRGARHRFVNVGQSDASVLVLVTPGGFESYFRERVLLDPSRDLDELTRVAERFGMFVEAGDAPAA